MVFVGTFSFLSHLVENHKHVMTGFFEVSKSTSYILNRLDVFGVLLVFARFLYLYGTRFGFSLEFVIKHYLLTGMLIAAFLLNLLSEYDKIPATKKIFVTTHSMWDVGCLYIY